MNILIIGNLGYVGPMLVKHFNAIHPQIFLAGYDIGYFTKNYTSNGRTGDTLLNKQYYGDVRNFDESILKDFDAIIYLAAISNDPMGNAFEKSTLDINCHSAINIAQKAKKVGVKHFVFASSCSVYGFADTAPRTENSEVNPLTAYAKSKVFAEQGLRPLADKNFQITCLRFATACGFSDRLRLDLVLNDFVASAIAEKKITILSDGTPWRPLIHVKDMARAMDWAIHRKEGGDYLVINTGSNQWNYQVKDLAEAVKKIFADVDVSINSNAQPDKRSYKVCFDAFEKLAPLHQPQVSLSEAVEDLRNGLQGFGFSDKNFRQSDLIRLKAIQKLIDRKVADENLGIKNIPAHFIESLIEFEKEAGYPYENVRDAISGPLCDELFMSENFEKTLQNGLKIKFVYNSKIAREFLLSDPAVPNHVWEPQTTKLLLHFSKAAKNVIIAGAYFGDQAIPVANNIKQTGICHTFEPNKNNSDLIIENAIANDLKNIVINNLALWNKSNEKLVFEGEDALASTVEAKGDNVKVLHTITIDDYVVQHNIKGINLLMIDVEGSEIKVLEGARRMLGQDKPVVVFETHSLYNDWSNGLQNSDSVKLMKELGYEVFAVREFHQNIDTGSMPVELLPLDRTYCETPPHHGFNLLAVPDIKMINHELFKVVYDLSPKLILHKTEALFHPSKF